MTAPTGAGLGGVTISVTGSDTLSTTTNALGNYSVTLLGNGTYTLTASLTGYTFSAPAVFSNLAANQTANFTALSLAATKVGVFRNNNSFLEDSNGNRQYDSTDVNITTFVPPGGAQPGDLPVTGDWSGNGRTKVGIYRPSTGTWWLDTNGDNVLVLNCIS